MSVANNRSELRKFRERAVFFPPLLRWVGGPMSVANNRSELVAQIPRTRPLLSPPCEGGVGR
jgi:hypothetical protein